MIISHKHRYLFLELPHTGTRAINRELIENYAGERILSHHSNLYDFRRRASAAELSYFVFSALRNPLDLTVSQFFKYKKRNDSESLPGRRKKARRIHELVFDQRRKRQIELLSNPDVTFSKYFREFYKMPYDNWASVCHQHCQYIVRFESIQEDFSAVMEMLNIPQVRPLPKKGKTVGRRGHFSEFYSEDTRQHAVNIFGPFMEHWNYVLPSDWAHLSISDRSRAEFAVLFF